MPLYASGYRRGIVAAPHRAAAEAGRLILAEGGNALEAMVAMAAAITAVYPHMNHLGGDGFFLIREPSGRIRAIMGAGPAGSGARVELYRGHESIPPRGPLAALTVPGALGTWILALEAAKALGARLPLPSLLAPAIGHAQSYVVTPGQARLTAEKFSELEAVPGFADAFLSDGKPPQAGARLKQTALAATLEHLARAGLDDFYRGDVAREIAADLDGIGSPVSRADLAGYRACVDEPLSVSLILLALFDRLRIEAAESFDHVHGLVEATKRAFLVRDRIVTDPDRLPHPPERYLAQSFLDAEARRIDRRKAAPWPASPQRGDTVWMGAADGSGLVVSYIQSLYWEFGAGCVLPGTGVLMQNRGASFSLDPQALNMLAPGRRPFHTLNPALAALRDGRMLAYGTMGGDGQPQTQAALFTRLVFYGQPLEEAIDRPRWLLGRTWGSPRTSLRLEARFPASLIEQLADAGHDIEELDESYSDTMGHAGAIVVHPNGSLEAGHDPRADGGAEGV